MGTSLLHVRKNPGNDRSEDRCKSIPLTHRFAKCYLKLSVVSLALFYPKGDIRKTSKTKLLKLLNSRNYHYQDINMLQQLLLISWLRYNQPTSAILNDFLM